MRLLLRRQSVAWQYGRRLAPYELRANGQRVPLNYTQGLYVLAFFCHPILSEMDLGEIRWPDPDAMPDQWAGCISTEICRLNKTLIGVNARIVTRARYYRLLELEALEKVA